MRLPLLALALVTLVAACASDNDGDGLTADVELEIGTDPENPDTDGDGLSDGEEYLDHKTDPTLADTDCDGFDDKTEVDDQSDPNDPLSYDRETPGRWPDLRCYVPEGVLTGYGPAAMVPDVSGVDQFGNTVSLHQFYGNIVVINMSAGWCSVCRDAGPEVQELYDLFKDRGLAIIHAMTDDESQDSAITDETFLKKWSDEFELTSPVTNTGRELYEAFREKGYNVSGSMPFFMILGRDLKPRREYTGWSEDAVPIGEDYLDTILQQPPPWE